MPTPQQIQQALEQVNDHNTFIQTLLIDTLHWNISDGVDDIGDIAYGWTEDDLGAQGLTSHLVEGKIFQIQNMRENQPWGIFILQFNNPEVFTSGRGLIGPLRKVLRGLVPKRFGGQSTLPKWQRENLLFICTYNYQHYRFAYFKDPLETGRAAPLHIFGWNQSTPARTACEFNLPHLAWPREDATNEQWLKQWALAFDVEKLTDRFYTGYEQVFQGLQGYLNLPEANDKKMFAQILMNRLMFLRFIEKKCWLRFPDTPAEEYLKYLYQAGGIGGRSWYQSRLRVLFFEGLAIANHNQEDIIGEVPYLNGGLFQETDYDRQVADIPDEAFESILGPHGLFYRYNFTVEESTPLDVEVAVDPEMLGKVFEKLVIARRETGSYYTPRLIVQFMCREALKGYLGIQWAELIDEHKNDTISVPQARELLSKLAQLKVVDPACGSGAYILGMLQELYTINELLDSRADQATPRDAYHRKLQIISNNIYGVDLDEFAVNIARLRLWLSLAVDFQGNQPDPLPNLDFKIETGNSLTVPTASGIEGDQSVPVLIRHQLIERFNHLKSQYLVTYEELRKAEIKEELNALRHEIIEFTHPEQTINGFDWWVEFSEVFVNGGFHIAIANPPYGIKVEDNLRNQYFNQRNPVEKGQSKDTYGIFIARGLQLLKSGGTMSYIVSDTWRTIKSHRPLRKRLLETTSIAHVLDLPPWIFDATVNTGILTLSKVVPADDHALVAGDLRAIEKDNWKALDENLRAISGHGEDVQSETFARYTYSQRIISTYSNLSFFIGSPSLYSLMSDSRFTKLENIANVKQGLATADNEYYLRKRVEARGSYDILDENRLLTDEDIGNLSEDEKNNGVDPERYEGRHFLPYDKGGASDAEEGWLPNYYVPTEYFIDWSREAVQRLRTATVADVKRRKGEEDNVGGDDETKIASRFQNAEYYFSQGITFSPTGFYAPTFRLLSPTPFDKEGSAIISEHHDHIFLLGVLCSALSRYQNKQFVNHTVHAMQGDISEIPMLIDNNENIQEITNLVNMIIERQQEDLKYSYYLHEQKEIDSLIYHLYGLNEIDIREVELWYCRRYPKLAESQGVISEVKEKYAAHLDRCRRILEKPPAYWRSNPILQLIAQGEGNKLEFKETLEYDIRQSQRSADVLKSSLKTVAGFLNAEGGTLLIGVTDSGEIKGLDRDFAIMNRCNQDRFEQKLRSYLNDRIQPSTVGLVAISFEELTEGTVCRVDVRPIPQSEIVHLDNEVYVRNGNQTKQLVGRELTDWTTRRARDED